MNYLGSDTFAFCTVQGTDTIWAFSTSGQSNSPLRKLMGKTS